MSQFPYLPLWIDAWVADTLHLTRQERGTYHDLLLLMWRTPHCRVPNDDAWLAKHMRMTPGEVADELRPIIVEFCTNDGNWITQKRLQKEFVRSFEIRTQRTVAAKSRWGKEKGTSKRNAGNGRARMRPAMRLDLERKKEPLSVPRARATGVDNVENPTTEFAEPPQGAGDKQGPSSTTRSELEKIFELKRSKAKGE